MKKKIFGIPMVGIISIITVLAVAGGAALGAWLYTREQGAVVEVLGSNFELFEADGVTPLDPVAVLDFNGVRLTAPSDTINLVGLNTGTDSSYPEIWVNDLGMGLFLTVNGLAVGDSGSPLALWAAEVAGDVTGILGTNTLASPADDTQTTLNTTLGLPGGVVAGMWIIFADTGEICEIVTAASPALEVIRGVNGTTATAHAGGATLDYGDTLVVFVPADLLEADETLSLALELTADGTAVVGEVDDFSIVVSVTSDY